MIGPIGDSFVLFSHFSRFYWESRNVQDGLMRQFLRKGSRPGQSHGLAIVL